MIHDHSISALRFTPCSKADQQRGLLGYIQFQHGSVRLDSVALRRTRRGRLELSYPERTRGKGKRYPIFCPASDEAREGLEAAVLASLYPKLVELGMDGAV